MSLETPLWMQPVTGDAEIQYSALNDRELLAALFRAEGVIGSSDLKVTQRAAGANFSVDISPGRAAIQGDDVSDQGMYLVTSTASENRTVPSPPASGTRVHRVVARVRDKLHNAGFSVYDWVPQVLEDTGTGTPATPASAISLATVSVAAGQPSVTDDDITDTRPFAQLLEDTDWVTVTIVNHWNQNSGNPLRLRRVGKTVNLSGAINRGGTFSFTAGNFEQFGSAPTQFRPGHALRNVVDGGNGDQRNMVCGVLADGTLQIDLDGDALPAGAGVVINMTWLVD